MRNSNGYQHSFTLDRVITFYSRGWQKKGSFSSISCCIIKLMTYVNIQWWNTVKWTFSPVPSLNPFLQNTGIQTTENGRAISEICKVVFCKFNQENFWSNTSPFWDSVQHHCPKSVVELSWWSHSQSSGATSQQQLKYCTSLTASIWLLLLSRAKSTGSYLWLYFELLCTSS